MNLLQTYVAENKRINFYAIAVLASIFSRFLSSFNLNLANFSSSFAKRFSS